MEPLRTPRKINRIMFEMVAKAGTEHFQRRYEFDAMSTFSKSLCLPPARTQRCAVVAMSKDVYPYRDTSFVVLFGIE